MDNSNTKIGKDVIESLTLGMYKDARFVFREYIQNSADQIDRAVEQGIFDSTREGKIEIEINCASKLITIYDNATGIESSKVQSVLKNIAQSTKDRSKNKGFRGIGRLGGIAYCDKLIFETSFKGEDVRSILIWDSQKLKSIINNRSEREEAHEVIDEVTEFITEPEKKDVHYFKVSLEAINNKALLNKYDIYEYLSMVAPVPFGKGFIVFKDQILKKAEELDFNIDEYSIFLNKDQVFKSYTSTIYDGNKNDKKRDDEIYDIEAFEIESSRGKLLAWGWYSISLQKRQMPSINIARGIRLRKGNIQIGLESTLDKLFKEDRWSKYFYGEIHAVHSNLIPNARRDYFLETDELFEFEKLTKNKFYELQRLNYFSSDIRSQKRKIDDLIAFTKEYEEKTKDSGFTNKEEIKQYQEKFDLKKESALKAEKELNKIESSISSSSQKKIYEKLIGEKQNEVEEIVVDESKGKPKFMTDELSKFKSKDRKLISKILTIIDSVLTKDLADNVKSKIIEELK